MENKNMDLWNRHCNTKREDTREVKYGARKFTAIDAYSQVREATKEWGPYGNKWGVRREEYNTLTDENICLYQAELYYHEDGKECSLPISSDIELVRHLKESKVSYNADWSKKVKTDALTKGLSMLGFNADVFFGKFDDNKYVSEADKPQASLELIEKSIAEFADNDELRKYYNDTVNVCSFESEADKERIITMFKAKAAYLVNCKQQDEQENTQSDQG